MKKLVCVGLAMAMAGIGIAKTTSIDGVEWEYFEKDGHIVIGNGSTSAISSTTTGRIVIPNRIAKIEVRELAACAFYGCRMNEVVLPDTIRAIGNSAFCRCAELHEVVVPKSVETIGGYAFAWCRNLVEVSFRGDAPAVAANEWPSIFYGASEGFKIQVRKCAQGWGLQDQSYWYGFAIEFVSSDYVIVPAEVTGAESIVIDEDWAVGYPGFSEMYGTEIDKAVLKGNNKMDSSGAPMFVWQDYVAGTDPTDPKSTFKARIKFRDGKAVVSWEPALNGLDENGRCKKTGVRTYRVLGSTDLKTWREVFDGEENKFSFFKVNVEMP